MGPEGSALHISENGQDFFVLDKLCYKKQGFFVDIGAADGITGSNTFILEKFYKWNGICIDPNPALLKSLCGSRDVIISDLCVYKDTGQILPFKYLNDPTQFYGWNLRAGLEECIQDTAVNLNTINVLTVSLNDLLKLYRAPVDIDYISIDTEGSEYEILSTFDFSKYNVKIITVEHKSSDRQKIKLLLESNGFELVDFAPHIEEDRYINKELIK